MEHVEPVPVKIHGIDVGIARVNADGSIEMTIGASALGAEIFDLLRVNMVEGLSIHPISTPARPAVSFEPSCETYRLVFSGFDRHGNYFMARHPELDV
jgi:hypothetical protein